jgi:hypothetical protein
MAENNAVARQPEEIQDGTKKAYAIVRHVSGLPAETLPDEKIHAIWKYAGTEVRDAYELAVFLSVATRHGLDPMAGEVFAFPAEGKIRVWAGRDGFVKAANNNPHYQGHAMALVHANDRFRAIIGAQDVEIQHEINGFDENDRGGVIGGWFVGYTKGRRPVFITRKLADYAYLFNNTKKVNWQRDRIGMFENRILRAGLVRCVPLGDLHIQGEMEDFDTQPHREGSVGRSTKRRLEELRANLVGLGADEPSEEQQKRGPSLDELRLAFDQARQAAGIPNEAILAWCLDHASIPRDPREWNEEHLIFATGALADAGGREIWTEYAYWLASQADLDFEQQATFRQDVIDAPTAGAVREIVERLEERVPAQRRKP